MGEGLRANQDHRQLVQARIVADQQHRAYRLGDAVQNVEDGAGGGEVERVHRLDQRHVVPGSQRLQGLQCPPCGGDQDKIGDKAQFAHRLTHGTTRRPAAGVERTRVVGKLRVVPQRLGVAEQEKLAQSGDQAFT